MQESVERILTNWSIDGTGPLTRSVTDLSTSGWIGPDAAHWAIEPFLPIELSTLLAYLDQRSQSEAELDDAGRVRLMSVASIINEEIDRTSFNYHNQFAKRYHGLDPDSDCKLPQGLEKAESQDAGELMELCDQILSDAAYTKLTQDDIEQCVGVASHWGVPLHVNFELFRHLAVYSRGDVIGRRMRRSWRSLYRMEMTDVAVYQRLVVLFQLAEDHEMGETLTQNQFHLRIFKNIPKQDVDMLLPGTRVKLSKLDRARFIVPSIGGWLMSLQKISRFVLVTAVLAAYYSTALVIGLVVAGAAYLVKSFLSYFQTKNKYLLDLTRNLYFQKLDANAGAAFQVIQQAARQSSVESILAYYALATEREPISKRRLRRKCERLIREAIEVEVDFRADRAVERIIKLGIVEETEDDRLRVAPLSPDRDSVDRSVGTES